MLEEAGVAAIRAPPSACRARTSYVFRSLRPSPPCVRRPRGFTRCQGPGSERPPVDDEWQAPLGRSLRDYAASHQKQSGPRPQPGDPARWSSSLRPADRERPASGSDEKVRSGCPLSGYGSIARRWRCNARVSHASGAKNCTDVLASQQDVLASQQQDVHEPWNTKMLEFRNSVSRIRVRGEFEVGQRLNIQVHVKSCGELT
jgi:hypothetical protein